MTLPITASTALGAHRERLLARAAELETRWYDPGRIWTGANGTPVSADEVAALLEEADKALDPDGWDPRASGLQQLLGGAGDVAYAAVTVLELIICADTDASAAQPLAWDLVPGRTAGEVRTLLRTGAAYAQHYGPGARRRAA
ncbi:hypothetical protein [Streptomyces sp. NPDC050600]|uniref:hypothetical protein n=1 Tax=Streptomyces sp. NPDC050600 TaxID=3157213 RepID=UPI00342A6C50